MHESKKCPSFGFDINEYFKITNRINSRQRANAYVDAEEYYNIKDSENKSE